MYGMVNKAIEDMVLTHHGEACWVSIKARARVDTDALIRSEPYPDADTYALVGAGSEVLRFPPDQILRAFGEHRVRATAPKGSRPLVHAAGSSFSEFIPSVPEQTANLIVLFNTPVAIERVRSKQAGDDHDAFLLRW